MQQKKNSWWFSLLLLLPMVLFFLGYLFNHADYLQPTGFIQYDNVSYIAFAKQYLDSDQNHLFYSNPFNDSANYTPIYFQVQTVFFAFLLKIGVPPGWILIPFTLLCSFFCFRILIAIYDHLIPISKFRTLHICFLSWGGGLLFLSGLLAQAFIPTEGDSLLMRGFVLDPELGWWGLNFGRSLFFSSEAYYHLLFIGCIYSLLRKNWKLAFFLLLLTSLSHPFTGIELICIVCFWCTIEWFFTKQKSHILLLIGSIILLISHVYYYLIHLNQFPDHLSVSHQYSLNWRLRFFSMIPAYSIVGLLAISSIYLSSVKKFFTNANNRLFGCWFLVAFILANHEIFMDAKQPIHFTRGYIWTSLFLLGLPALQHFSKTILNFSKVGFALFALLFFSDNLSWILNNMLSKATKSSATYITKEQHTILTFLSYKTGSNTLLISNDKTISYLSTVYTKAYPWLSHPFTTPFVNRKREALEMLKKGHLDATWKGRNTVFILDNFKQADLNLKVKEAFQTKNYRIYFTR